MELKTKYQYTYFIYPYIIEERKYTNYIYKMLKNKKCKLKLFDKQKDLEIASYFLPEIKEKMFYTLNLDSTSISNYKSMDIKMQARLLSKEYCNIFEYILDKDIPGKIGEKEGIFFDINKVEIVCFNTGICFLLMKTVLDDEINFSDVLNFNYKFRDIQSKIAHSKQYDNIKIQTQKLNNMQKFSEFITQIIGINNIAQKINLDTNKLITYSYACLNQESWNENTDINIIEKEFKKYRNIKPANEEISNEVYQKTSIYQDKYLYYGFSNDSTMLLTSECNIKNYTEVLYKYENVQLYHFIYNLHQKIYLKKLNYQFKQIERFESTKTKFIEFAKKDWIYEITNNQQGITLDKYYRQAQDLDDTFNKLKIKYDLLNKEYEQRNKNRYHKWIISIIGIFIIINLIKIWIYLLKK